MKLPRAARELLREIVLLDSDESNPFDGGRPTYEVPSLDDMAKRAVKVLGTTRDVVLRRAQRSFKRRG